ncbi:MAG: ParB/RepB/Spo0J family partition protein, partial [Geminicoccaceae bacterium]
MLLEAPVAEIVIAERHRKDMGDLRSLAESMRELGLLQPIGITGDHRLVFGERRVKAAQMLGWTCILARVVDIPSIIAGEYAENEIRKDFTPSERVALAEAIRTLRRGGDRLSDQFRNCGTEAIRTDDAARRAGFTSQDQFERARNVIAHGTPQVVAAMDAGKASISAAAILATQPPDFQSEVAKGSAAEIREAVAKVRAAQDLIKTSAPSEVRQAVAEREVPAVDAAAAVRAFPEREEPWTPANIRAVARDIRAEVIREQATEAEAQGEGNAVTAFMREHGRIPSPTEANRIARDTGAAVVGSDGRYHLGLSAEETARATARAEIWFGFKEPTWRLAELPYAAEVIVAEIPPYQANAVRRKAAAAAGLLTAILQALETRDAAA